MNKTDLIKSVSVQSGLTIKDSSAAVNAVLDAILKAVRKHEAVTLLGFGSFAVKQRKARQGVNPQTKKPMKIAARKVVKFTPSSKMAVK